MTRAQLLRRYAWAVLVAVMLAFGVKVMRAADDDQFPIQDPRVPICAELTPYGWWWFAIGCNELMTVYSVTATYEDGRTLHWFVQVPNPPRKER